MEFVIRCCEVGDEFALSLVGKATFLETYAGSAEGSDLLAYTETEHSVDRYRGWLESELAHIWIAETSMGRSAIGYLVALTSQNADSHAEIEIKRLYLLYRFHGNGLGRRLLNEILARARQNGIVDLCLRVQDINQDAINFYARTGFRVVADEPFRAGKGDYKVLVMKLALGTRSAEGK